MLKISGWLRTNCLVCFFIFFFVMSFFIASYSVAQDKIILSVTTDNTPGLESSSLYSMEPDGTGRRKLFDFKWNMFDSSGQIFDLAVDADGKTIFFSSGNGYMWTPLRRNLFSVRSDGSGFDQMTPLADSGNWNEICQNCGRVEGYVKKSNGEPWGGAPVFLEGMSMVNAGVDGSFRFENVPPGVHNVVAYRPGDANVFTFIPVQVAAGTVSQAGTLVPDSSGRLSLDKPDFFGGALYYRQSPGVVKKVDMQSGSVSEIYSTTFDGCSGVTEVSGFDVAPVSGNVAIVDYATGCTGHQGVYLADKDGGGLRPFLDFKSNPWCGAGETAWSPDEKMLAITACYNWTYGLVIVDRATLNLVGTAWLPSQSGANFYNFHLHGWSPDGNWLLYSLWQNTPENTTLTKIKVDSSAENYLLPNNGAVEQQLFAGAMESAVWADLNTPDVPPSPVLTAGVSGGRVDCAWSEVQGADGYTLYYAPHPAMSPIGQVDMGKQTGFSVELPHGSAYYVAVWPYNIRGDSFGVSNIGQFFIK